MKVSVLDDEMFIIQKIITHRWNDTRTKLEFLILWYGVEDPEWIQYDKKMNTNIYVLMYLDTNGLKELITTAQRRRLEEEDIPNQTKKVRFSKEDST